VLPRERSPAFAGFDNGASGARERPQGSATVETSPRGGVFDAQADHAVVDGARQRSDHRPGGAAGVRARLCRHARRLADLLPAVGKPASDRSGGSDDQHALLFADQPDWLRCRRYWFRWLRSWWDRINRVWFNWRRDRSTPDESTRFNWASDTHGSKSTAGKPANANGTGLFGGLVGFFSAAGGIVALFGLLLLLLLILAAIAVMGWLRPGPGKNWSSRFSRLTFRA
jgi:hypothetical protein